VVGYVRELDCDAEDRNENERLHAENAKLRGLLKDVLGGVEWSSPRQLLKLRIERELWPSQFPASGLKE